MISKVMNVIIRALLNNKVHQRTPSTQTLMSTSLSLMSGDGKSEALDIMPPLNVIILDTYVSNIGIFDKEP